MTTEKRKDGELGSLFWMCIIFGGLLFAVDIFYSAWGTMPGFWKGVGVALNVICAGLIAIIFIKKDDPAYDDFRKVFCVLALGTIIYVCAFRAGLNETISVNEDSSSSKQEQTK